MVHICKNCSNKNLSATGILVIFILFFMCLLQAINVRLKLLCLWSGSPLLFFAHGFLSVLPAPKIGVLEAFARMSIGRSNAGELGWGT